MPCRCCYGERHGETDGTGRSRPGPDCKQKTCVPSDRSMPLDQEATPRRHRPRSAASSAVIAQVDFSLQALHHNFRRSTSSNSHRSTVRDQHQTPCGRCRSSQQSAQHAIAYCAALSVTLSNHRPFHRHPNAAVTVGAFCGRIPRSDELRATSAVTALLLLELFDPVALIGFYLARQRNAAVKC